MSLEDWEFLFFDDVDGNELNHKCGGKQNSYFVSKLDNDTWICSLCHKLAPKSIVNIANLCFCYSFPITAVGIRSLIKSGDIILVEED